MMSASPNCCQRRAPARLCGGCCGNLLQPERSKAIRPHSRTSVCWPSSRRTRSSSAKPPLERLVYRNMKSGLWSAGLAAMLCAAGAAAFAQQGKPATTTTTTTAPATATTTTANSNAPADIPTSGSAGTISVKANLVVMPAIVRDKKGALVNDLKKENFSLEVDGQAQPIRYFDHDTDVPLTLGLLVDVSGSMRNELDPEKTASQSFLDTMLAPSKGNRGSDKAFIVQFAKEVELLQDATDAQPRLQRALRELGTSSPS